MRKPNLLFILTDEQRADTLAAYGNAHIEMPNLNRLASMSTVFENTYVTQPVCTPSRGSLMTGLYPHTHGCIVNNTALPESTPCLPEMLTQDYATANIGKWHLGDELFAQHGFKEWVSIEDGYNEYFRADRDKNARSSYHHFLNQNGISPDGEYYSREQATRLPEELGKPSFMAREASRFICDNARRPFVLSVNFLEPDMPFFGPRDAQYEARQIPLPPNFDATPSEHQHLKPRLLQKYFYEEGFGGQLLQTEDDWRQLIGRYWGLCSLIDTHVGTILNTLQKCGLDDNTIVVFTSDHGDMMGSHRMVAKSVMFEEALRVPLLIRLPGQKEAQHVSAPTSQIDLVPTILDVMDEQIPSHLQGQSLRPTLEGKAQPMNDVVAEWNLPSYVEHGEGSDLLASLAQSTRYPKYLQEIVPADEAFAAACDTIRTLVTPDGWKFSYSERGEHELYNLHSDSGETNNLAPQSDARPIMKEMGERIQRWQQRTEDNLSLPSL